MNPDQINALIVKCYDSTYQVCADLGAYVRANAPDDKASNKARSVVSAHSDLQYARDLLYSLYGAFDELDNRSWDKTADSQSQDYYTFTKHRDRADFYHDIAKWASACYDLVKEGPVIEPDCPKDAEDDSDPYVKPSPNDTPMETALAALQDRLLMADFGKRRVDSATALYKSVVLERPSGATVLDVLERFGDEASELSWGGEYSSACFWDACVQISDDLRSDLAADSLKKASTVTVPEPDAVLWEVTGDPDKALYRTEKDAMRATRELFPKESMAQCDMRLRYRHVKTFN